MLIEKFYLREPALVETFNKRPDEFDFIKYLQDCP
jgi:hypothetical protein